MEKEFIPYEQALELKALGFDEQCFSFYDTDGELYESEGYYKIGYNVQYDEIIAPLYQQSFRWFREKYGLYSEIFVDDNKTFGFLITSFIEEGRLDKPITRQFNTYKEAELGCIKQLIEIIDRKAEAYS
jgi:hypothetical protein